MSESMEVYWQGRYDGERHVQGGIFALDARDVLFALDLANAIREEELSELPFSTSTPNEEDSCVLAQAFNFDCVVGYSDRSFNYPLKDDEHKIRGYVTFHPDNEQQAETLAGELGSKTYHRDAPGEVRDRISVPLPDRVTSIAVAFDDTERWGDLDKIIPAGWESLPETDDEGLILA